jgi:hypothetical protein
VTGTLPRLRKFDTRPHREQTPAGSQLSGGVSGFDALVGLDGMIAPQLVI